MNLYLRIGVPTILMMFLTNAEGRSQDDSASDTDSTMYEHEWDDSLQINTTRLAIVGGTVVVAATAIHLYQANGWWKNSRRSFHFREDLTYALHVDKIGHFFGATGATFVMSRAFRWANYSETNSLLLGAGVSTLFQTYIEIEDGFSTWGFDRVDFAANVAGAWYPVAQHFVPTLREFNLKISYLPSRNINQPGAFSGQKHILMDDYEGQTFWLSVNVNNILPGSVEPYWPDFLALAVGYGARDILTQNPYRVYFVSLDYDMSKIIPQTSDFLRTLTGVLNFIRFPAPTVQISPNAIWYGLYF
ncbi:MAG: DUF2279 domain-containing protein [Bacteroidota bacterium]